MRAMVLDRITSVATDDRPLRECDVPVPVPGIGEVRIAVRACGVCHTELDEIEGRTAPCQLPVIPGHEVVGRVDELGDQATRFRLGDRVGVGWIYASDGTTRENLSTAFRATGRDVNGGYAPFLTVNERYAYRIPDVFSDAEAAPLLCAGAIGYRALRLAGLRRGGRLGLTGFGACGHLLLPLARHEYPDSKIAVFARDAESRQFARSLGADWCGQTHDAPPWPLDAIIDTTPAWTPVIAALANLAPGGRLVINAIRKEHADHGVLRELSYRKHLWMEREIKTVANITGEDIATYLPIAARIPIRPTVNTYALREANAALVALERDSVRGANVLLVEQ
ncbi:MAG: alcohol dehydrogenase catalytic domain-containing protein [Pseudomonadota bacterium]